MNKFITLVTAFKKFKGLYNMIQHSALYSWKAQDIQVIASANEVGVDTNCAGYSNVSLIPDVKRAREIGFENQSPIVRDLIEKSLLLAKTPMMGLINSDIILTEGFADRLTNIFDKYGFNIFLVVSRHNVQLNYTVNSPETYKQIQEEKRLPFDASTSSDLFITSKYWWRKIISTMPDFILGRYAWDNWLHMYAELNINKDRYNGSKALNILHCDHSHVHIFTQEKAREKEAPSSQHNIKLWEKTRGVYGTTRISDWKVIEL
jgi:hypothetical protein